MFLIYSARYHIDIGLHVFPTAKYRQVEARLLEARLVAAAEVVEPAPATRDELRLVHTSEYLDRLDSGSLDQDELAQLELPWSKEMVDGFRLMVGGTIDAALLACGAAAADLPSLRTQADRRPGPSGRPGFRASCHIGGGLHHAFPNHGEGFCPFNDVAVAVRVLQRRGIERVAIVDLDVHHGNGTAFVFESDPRVFTFSMHQQHNYPLWKPRGTLDVGLADGTHDAAYLGGLERALPRVMAHEPECVFYLAGADPYEEDQLGGLRLTKAGLRMRDRMVVAAARAAGVPLVVLLAGGYARRVDDTVEIHVATVEEAASGSPM